jgi:hypothetical protein
MKLETALTATERRERLTGHLVWMSFPVAFVLMFVGGSGWAPAFRHHFFRPCNPAPVGPLPTR